MVKLSAFMLLCIVMGSCSNSSKQQSKESMSINKETVTRYMAGFNEKDHAVILSCLTDDVVWELPGVYLHSGKAAFDKEIENEGFTGKPIIHVNRLTEQDDVVIAEGTVQATKKDGTVINLVFCDVFEMENGLVKKLTSYLMAKAA